MGPPKAESSVFRTSAICGGKPTISTARGRLTTMSLVSESTGRRTEERGLRWSLLPPCPPCLIPPASSVSVVVFVRRPELPADLAARSQRRMDVGIHGAVADGADDLCKLPWCDALGRRPDDVSRSDGPRHG